MDMALALEDGAIQNIFIALVVAYFILFTFTGNFLVPLAAILSIGSTITWVLTSVLLVGYKFDVVMSVLVVMIVGMSVDYAARELLHASSQRCPTNGPTKADSCTVAHLIERVACVRPQISSVSRCTPQASLARPQNGPTKADSCTVARTIGLI